jgi:Holliday junction resolvase RusA-like endonuclease
VNLFVPGNPVPQGSKRALLRKGSNIPVVVDANRIGLHEWRAQVSAYAMQANAGDKPLTKNVAIRLDFLLARPANHFLPVNGKRAEPELRGDAPTYVGRAPDLDKLVRSVFDAMTDAGVWLDDAQVVKVVASKAYCTPGDRPGVHISLAPWGN